MQPKPFVPSVTVDTIDYFGWRRPAKTSNGRHCIRYHVRTGDQRGRVVGYVVEERSSGDNVFSGTWEECVRWLESQYGTQLVIRNFVHEGYRRQFGFQLPDALKERMKDLCYHTGVTMTEWLCATIDLALRWETSKVEKALKEEPKIGPNRQGFRRGGETVLGHDHEEESEGVDPNAETWANIQQELEGSIRAPHLREFFMYNPAFTTELFVSTFLTKHAQRSTLTWEKLAAYGRDVLERWGFESKRENFEGKPNVVWRARPRSRKDEGARLIMWQFRQGYDPFVLDDVAGLLGLDYDNPMREGLREFFDKADDMYLKLGEDKWKRRDNPLTATRNTTPLEHRFRVAEDDNPFDHPEDHFPQEGPDPDPHPLGDGSTPPKPATDNPFPT